MIMQIRIHDYNMERCTFAADIPTYEGLQVQGRELKLAGDTSAVEIWSLESPMEINPMNIAWNTRPTRKALIGTLRIEEGLLTETAEFACGPSGSLQTFEFACSPKSPDCYIEFWQEQPEKRPRLGEPMSSYLKK